MSREAEDIHNESNSTVNYDQAFELSGHGWYNRLVLVACCVTSNAVALDMFGFSIVVAAARCDLKIGLEETGLLASAPFAGILFAFPWGYFADVHGRRRALLVSTTVGFFFASLSSFTTSWQAMLVLKLIGCCFFSSAPGSILTVAYLGESTGSVRRSQYMFYMNSMNMASEIVSFSLAFFILSLNFNVPLPWFAMAYRSWRLYTLILALPLGLGALMLFFLYESPKFLANAGQTDRALQILKKIYAFNGGKNDYPVQSLSKVEVKADTSFWNSVARQTVPLFKPPLLWMSLQLSFLMAVCCATNNVFLMWFPTIVNIFFTSMSNGNDTETGFCQQIRDNITLTNSVSHTDIVTCDDTISLNALYSGIIVGVFVTLLNLSVTKIATYRRLVLMSVLLFAGISCLLVGLLKHPLASLLFFALIQSTAVGLGSISSYIVDLYPTSYRGLASGFVAMVARFSSFLGVIVIGNVIVQHCSITFYMWALLTFCGVGVSLLLPSDRKANVAT